MNCRPLNVCCTSYKESYVYKVGTLQYMQPYRPCFVPLPSIRRKLGRVSSPIDTASNTSNHDAIWLKETSSRDRGLMPSIYHPSCPLRTRGNQSIIMHHQSSAHHHHQHLSTPSPRATRRRDRAQAEGMDTTDAEAQRRALLHQSVESWTRRHRVEIR